QNLGSQKLSIILIPGWSMPAEIWRYQLEGLGQYYHVVALDPRGQGESDAPLCGYTAERRAMDLHELIKPFAAVLLVGWSLGAIEALQTVHMFGDSRIAGLVLVDSSVGEEPEPSSSEAFRRRLRENRQKTLYEFVGAIFRMPQPQAELERLVQSAQRMTVEQSLALLSYPFERTHWRRIVHGFKGPLLYLVTSQYEAQARNLQRNRPGTWCEFFRDAGHALFVDEAARFNRRIAEFAKGLPLPPIQESPS
ncbi:MAG TPA: alpha/beta hydrolase, partial [Terriglobales bacterium]|nr:alpha/beta hydrolase [Terriglobales bacterium]